MSAELEDIHEECGVFGVWGHQDAARLTYFGLHALQHRGQEGAGIVSNDNGKLHGYRGLGLLTQVFSNEQVMDRLTGNRAIGHVRYATAGSGSVDNIQPFLFRFHDGDVALAHNGNLTNCTSLRNSLEDKGSIFHSNSDTEILMHLIRHSSKATFMDRLKEALQTVHGGFAYLLLTQDALIGATDPNGFRPLSLGRMKNGAYVLASETCALDIVRAEFIRDIEPGEIIVINDDGYTIEQIRSTYSMQYAQWNLFISLAQILIFTVLMFILCESVWVRVWLKNLLLKQIWLLEYLILHFLLLQDTLKQAEFQTKWD